MSFDYFNIRRTASFFNIAMELFLRLPQSEETSRMLVTVRCIQWVVTLVENGRGYQRFESLPLMHLKFCLEKGKL